MANTPTSEFALGLLGLAQLIAACESFWEWVGADNAAEALGFVHLDTVEGASIARPCAYVFHTEMSARMEQEAGDGPEYRIDQSFGVLFEGIESAETVSDACIGFLNHVGAVVEEMLLKSGRERNNQLTTHFVIARMSSVNGGPMQVERAEAKAWGCGAGEFAFGQAFEVSL